MSDVTPRLKLPFMGTDQLQKELTFNELAAMIDTLLHASAKDKDLTAAPGAPVDGDTYIIGAAPTGVWAGKAQYLAFYIGGWHYLAPQAGWLVWVQDEAKYYRHSGAAWEPTLITGIDQLTDLTDVNAGTLDASKDGLALTYDFDTGKFVLSAVANLLANLTDVDVTGILDGQTLAWDTATSKFVPSDSTANSFLGLTDTPNAFGGYAGKMVVVSGTEDGLVFVDAPDGADPVTTILGLTDTPDAFTGQAGKFLMVNPTEDGTLFEDPAAVTEGVPAGGAADQVLRKATVSDFDVEWVDPSEIGIGVPALTGHAGKVLAVNGGETASEWIVPPAGYTDEQVRDVIAAALVAGSGITITPDDGADTLTITSTGGGSSLPSLVGQASKFLRVAVGEADVEWASGSPAGGATIGAQLYAAAAQSVPTATVTAIVMDTADRNVDGFWSSGVNPSRVTVPAGGEGWYVITGSVKWAVSGTGGRRIALRKNGTTNIGYTSATSSATHNDPGPSATAVAYLTVGDYVELVVDQNSGGNLSTQTSEPSRLQLARVHAGGGDGPINDLSDVDTVTTAPTNGQALVWSAAGSKWVPGSVASGGGALTRTTPTLRGSAIQAVSTASGVIALPAGTVAGDVAILFASGVWAPTAVSGWAVLDNQAGTNHNGLVQTKVLTPTDITAGSVTVAFAGAGDGMLALLVFQGATVESVRAITGLRSGAGAASVAFGSVIPQPSDYAAAYLSNRANSTDTITGGALLHTASATASSAALYGGLTITKTGVAETATFSAAGTGYYVTVVSVVGVITGGTDTSKYRAILTPRTYEPSLTNYATLDFRNGHPVLDFDTTTQETAMWRSVLSSAYAGTGLTVDVYVALTTAITGTVGFDGAFERLDLLGLDLDADSFGTALTFAAATVPSTSGQVLKLTQAFANGADLDGLSAGEMFRFRLRRDVANDTAAGDAEVLAVVIRET